jgi:hypothetical protein
LALAKSFSQQALAVAFFSMPKRPWSDEGKKHVPTLIHGTMVLVFV